MQAAIQELRPRVDYLVASFHWGETYVPDQTGANYTAHLTVGLDTVEHLKELQAEPFDAFDVHPRSLAVYQLGNNGTARTLLRAWPLTG